MFLLTTPSPLPMYFSRNRGFFYSNHYSNRGVQQILPQSLCPLQNCLNMVTSTTQATSPGARILPRKPTNVVPTAGKNFTKGEHPPHTTGGASGPASQERSPARKYRGPLPPKANSSHLDDRYPPPRRISCPPPKAERLPLYPRFLDLSLPLMRQRPTQGRRGADQQILALPRNFPGPQRPQGLPEPRLRKQPPGGAGFSPS